MLLQNNYGPMNTYHAYVYFYMQTYITQLCVTHSLNHLIQNLPGMLQSIQGMVADCTRSSAQKYCSGSECLVMTGTCTNTMRCYAEKRQNEITLTCLWTVTLHIRYMNHVHVTGNGFSLCLSSLRSSCLRFCCLRCNKTRQYGTRILLDSISKQIGKAML